MKIPLSFGAHIEEARSCTEAGLYVIPMLEDIKSASKLKILLSINSTAFTHRLYLILLCTSVFGTKLNFVNVVLIHILIGANSVFSLTPIPSFN